MTGPASVRGAIDARKLAEMRRKLASLDQELTSWEEQSAAGQDLEKHHTQVRRIASVLRATGKSIGDRLDRADASLAGIVTDAQAIERVILEVHRIWQFYREKLALRGVAFFQSYLAAADDFAWACYEPVCLAAIISLPEADRATARARFKEPPLTFFNGGSSPFTMPRGAAYDAEHVPGEGMTTIEVAALLQSLPVPVIGVPWFQLAQLPDALVIAHEVGHDIEGDLGLTADIEHAVTTVVPPERQAAWKSWIGEVFADVFGVLAAGSAFVGTLIDFLVTDPKQAAIEDRDAFDWGLYPTVHLRVLTAIAALRELDRVLREQGETESPFAGEATRIDTEWRTVFGSDHAMKSFVPDIEPVVRALMSSVYPSKPWGADKHLCDVFRFDSVQHTRAVSAAANANAFFRLKTESDVRCLMVAARLAFERKPAVDGKSQGLILDRIMKVRTSGVRAAAALGRTIALAESDARNRADELDATAGDALFKQLHARVGLAG